MSDPKPPARLRARGRKFWDEITDAHDNLDASQLLQLEEVCRTADRLEALDRLLTGDASDWVELVEKKGTDGTVEVVMDKALSEARQQQNILKQLVAALRLPDEATGKRPQTRPARGAHQPKGSGASGSVSSLDRARQAKSG